jgi:hypothetical protein
MKLCIILGFYALYIGSLFTDVSEQLIGLIFKGQEECREYLVRSYTKNSV